MNLIRWQVFLVQISCWLSIGLILGLATPLQSRIEADAFVVISDLTLQPYLTSLEKQSAFSFVFMH